MRKLQEKVDNITNQILTEEITDGKKTIISEMKKIGIESLPYAYTAMKTFIDSETMNVHYNKHYKGYVEKLNKALSKKDYGDLELEEIVKSISRFNKTIRDNAGGAFNHALFWKMLSPKPQKPTKDVLDRIKKDFGTFEKFKTKFEDIAKERFGSGWVWLVLTKRNTLKVVSTANQDNPLMNVIDGGYPLLGLDLWEHAYYLKYRNKRDEYIKKFWNAVNWEFVDTLYQMKLKTKINESIIMKTIIYEGKSEKCSRDRVEEIRMIFNINPGVKKIFRYGIESILKEVFNEHWYESGEYSQDSMSGVYDFEGTGRSVLNKLNTNYNAFCVLFHDLNSVLLYEGKQPLKLIGLPPFEQLSETKKFVKYLDHYKFRIFSQKSGTFKNILTILGGTNKMGDIREEKVVSRLKQEFGEENVQKVGELGGKSDMLQGVDCIINIDGVKNTAQIKPYSNISGDENQITVFGSGQVKKYTTNWIIFEGSGRPILIFKNKSTKIIEGNYTFDKDDLIYSLS